MGTSKPRPTQKRKQQILFVSRLSTDVELDHFSIGLSNSSRITRYVKSSGSCCRRMDAWQKDLKETLSHIRKKYAGT